MQITGTIIAEMPIKQGKTKEGNDWRTKRYVVQYEANEKYGKTVAFDVFGDNIEKFAIQVGKEYTIDIDINAKQWNGDYFNQIKAWRCYPTEQQQTQNTAQPQQATQPAPSTATNDTGLPF